MRSSVIRIRRQELSQRYVVASLTLFWQCMTLTNEFSLELTIKPQAALRVVKDCGSLVKTMLGEVQLTGGFRILIRAVEMRKR